MDSIATTSEPWHGKATFCRFCATPLSGGIFTDISLNKWFSSYVEIDEDLLKKTFDVQLSTQLNTSKVICANCRTRLNEAHSFKMLVLSTEQRLLEHYQGLVQQQEETISDDDSKEDTIKVEELPLEDAVQYDMDDQNQVEDTHHHDEDQDDEDQDDEILANIKPKAPKPVPKLNQKKSNTQPPEIPEIDIEESEKAILKLRGFGPLLRENSLKIISNSTLCVFQWDKSRYRCFCCKEPYSDINLLREHTNEHTLKEIEKTIIFQENKLVKVEVSVLFCKICNMEMENLTALREHLKNHGVSFCINKQEDLLVPFKINNDKALICQICNETYTVFRHLNMHMNKHFQTEICHICGAGFISKKFLNLHKYHSHNFKCRKCDMSFSSKMEKRDHNVKLHSLKINKRLRYPCPYCTERFKDERPRVIHLVEKHKFEKPEHKCYLCPKVFLTKGLCVNHIKNVHKKEKKHKCDVCSHLFYNKSDLTRHVVTHTGEKPYSCDVCNTTFGSKDSLRRHSKRAHV